MTEPLPEGFARRLAEDLDRRAALAGTPEAFEPAAADEDDDALFAAAVAARLGAESTWSGPPPELRAAVLARALAIAEPAGTGETTETAQAAEAPEPALAPVRELPRRRRLLWAVPMAAAAAAVFTLAVVATDRALLREDDAGTAQAIGTYAVTGTAAAPGAEAEATIARDGGGFSVVLDVTGLPPAPAGFYYAAWLTDGTNPVPIGSFHARDLDAPITLWSGVDPADFPTLTVTLQDQTKKPFPTGTKFLSGPVRD